MNGEGGEYGGKSREGHHEGEDNDDHRREARNLIDELEREQEESNEGKEQTEEEEEYRKQVQKMIDEAKEEYQRDVEDAETNEDAEHGWNKEAEKCVKDAVEDLERDGEDQQSHEASDDESKDEHGGESDSGRTEDTEAYHDGGAGQMYATKTESSEHTESKTESETKEETQDAEQEPAETQESSTSKENTGPKNTQSESEEPVDSEEGETEEQLRNRAQETTEKPEPAETSSKEAETNYQEKEMRETTTSEYSEEEAVQDEMEKGKKIETSSKSEVYKENESTVEPYSEPEHEETNESKLTNESEKTKHQAEPEDKITDFDDSAEKSKTDESSEQESEPTSEDREISEAEDDKLATSETDKDEMDEFVERVKEILNETPERDDNYDYVQDPLTGEMQRVPKILADYETDEQKQSRKLRNIFAELSEEERERFKELVRESTESEEERSAETVEKAWANIVAKAEQERDEIDVQEVHRLYYVQGLSMEKVGKKLGFKSSRPIQRIFREQGWEARPSGFQRKSEDYEEMYRLYFKDGHTLKEIAQRFGMDRHTIGKIFREQSWITRRTAAIQRSRILSLKTRQKSHSKRVIDTTEVYRLYFEEGLTMLEVAKRVGFKSSKPIQSVFRKQGWTTRGRDVIRKRESISKQGANKRGKSKSKKSEKILKRLIDPAEVYQLYFVDGLTMMDISKKLGFKSAYPVSQLFKEMGWKRFSGREYRKNIDVDDVYRLYYIEGLTKEEVARELEIPESRIRKVFKEMGWSSKIRKFETDEERALGRRDTVKKRLQRIKDLRADKFGTKCRLCGQTRKLAIHKKDGIEHERDLLWRLKNIESADSDEWAALCISCHRGIHWLMDTYGYEWDTIESLAARSTKPRNNEPLGLPTEDALSPPQYLEIKEGFNGDTEALRRALFGDRCYYCGVHSEEKKIPIHRKDGRPHDNKLTKREKYFRTLNPDGWVPLCNKHHRYVHWAMDTLNLEWDDLKSNS